MAKWVSLISLWVYAFSVVLGLVGHMHFIRIRDFGWCLWGTFKVLYGIEWGSARGGGYFHPSVWASNVGALRFIIFLCCFKIVW